MARGTWNSRTAFILAAVGSAVGLGNVWRFPYLTYEFGGGAFLIPYLIALFIIGLPLLMLELAIGQKMQAGAVEAFRKFHPKWSGLGVLAIFTAFIIVTYYAVVMAWALIYLLASWGVKWAGNSSTYFYSDVLQLTESVNVLGGINWGILAALVVVWVLIYFCIWKGVRSVGKIVVWTVPLPILLLVVLFIRGVTLPGFFDGWATYMTPVWSSMLNPQLWIAAVGQVFFTLSMGAGVMIAYASFNKGNDIRSDGRWIGLSDVAISLFAGFVVFAILGHMAMMQGVAVSEVAEAGPALAFVVFPEALSLLPAAGFFAILFFLTLLTLGIDSAFSLVESVVAGIKDSRWGKKLSTEKVSLWVCLVGFAMGLIYTTGAGLYFLDIIDRFTNQFGMVLVGFLEAVLIGWVVGPEKVRSFINETTRQPVGKWWNYVIKWLIPASLGTLLVLQFYKEITEPYGGYPGWALAIGWTLVALPLLYWAYTALIAKPQKA